jgi:RHS repeat-associated protein
MPYVPFIHHADYTAPKFTGDQLERMLAGRSLKDADNLALTGTQKISQSLRRGLSLLVCLAVVNATVPGSAIVDFGKPASEAIGAYRTQIAAKAKDLASRRARSATRLLPESELQRLQGRAGENPYLAGQQKWDVVYRNVDLDSGNYSTSVTDMSFQGGYGIPVNVTRSYSANDADEGPFGKGWSLSADVRSTAGGVVKAPGAPTLSVPQTIKERPAAESDPNLTTQPAAAVVETDASGREETVQKDADGILTTPPWDNNTSNCVYEFVTFLGQQYQILVSDQVTTPDGTIYTYQSLGSYTSGEVPWNNPTGAATPANVLKVTSVQDRQGNVTTYSYNTNITVSFNTSNGYITVNPLTSVSMPNGHVITFTWGDGTHAPTNRVWTVSDNSSPARVVTYGYNSGGMLTSVTTPAGRTTQYSYASATPANSMIGPQDTALNILSSITDPRGLTTTIKSCVAGGYINGTIYIPEAVCTYEIDFPNTTKTTYAANAFNGGTIGYTVAADERYATDWDTSGNVINNGMLHEFLYYLDSPTTHEVDITSENDNDEETKRELEIWNIYDPKTENLLQTERGFAHFAGNSEAGDNISYSRKLDWDPDANNPTSTDTVTTYNFEGNPLSQVVTEYAAMIGSTTPVYRTSETDYAYWDASKYFQQKAVWNKSANRYTYTDYFPSTAGAGQRGQMSYSWDPEYGQIYLNQNATIPTYMQNDHADWWKYQVSAPANTFSTAYAYDQYGRTTDTYKLKSTQTSPWTYIQTHTDYGSNAVGIWGASKDVVEDSAGIKRTTTNKGYTPWGTANDVINAAGHEFLTNYDKDGNVLSIVQVDTGQTVISYSYGTTNGAVENGQITSVTDGLSDVSQNISYGQVGSGTAIAQVTNVSQTGPQTSSVAYTYNTTGDRLTATYTTPYGTNTWGYYNYLPLGDPSKPRRGCQTIVKLDSQGNRTPEEYQYVFDCYGRVIEAAFAQTPSATSSNSTDGWYDSAGLAATRARAHYDYDAGGRMLDIYYYWDTLNTGTNSYTSIAVIGNACGYEVASGLNRGIKTSSTYYLPASQNSSSFAPQWSESFGYDPNLDYLTSFTSTDGQANSSQTWSYDPAGNRTDTAADSLNRPTTIGGTTVASDILGNRTASGTQQYGWDSQNRLISFSGSAGTTNYTYRGDGLRVAKTTGSNSSYYFYDGQMGIEDVDVVGSSTNVTDYGLGPRGIEMLSKNGNLSYPLYDVHGNSIGTLSRSGSGFIVSNERSYDPWGNIRLGAATGDPKGRYCANLGHKQDDESGLVYMRARYYETTSGRFINEDSKRSGQNWFVYGTDDPVNHFDVTGNNDGCASGAYWGAMAYMFSYIAVGYGGADLDAWVTYFNDGPYGSDIADMLNMAPTTLGCMLGGEYDTNVIDEIAQAYNQTLGSYIHGLNDAEDTPSEASELCGPALTALSAYGGVCEAELFMQDVDGILSD